MSHYLKVLLDAILGAENLRNEIVWDRTGSKGYATRKLSANHDVVLSYQHGPSSTWNADAAFIPYDESALDAKTADKYKHRDADGRLYRLSALEGPSDPRPNLTYEVMGVTRRWRWSKERMQRAIDAGIVVQTKPGTVPQIKRYLDEMRGRPLDDVWTDVPPINSQAAERLGYPTQKPVALLERLLQVASNEADVVLDPFCGCGTTIDAAQRLKRQWIGIDITYLAVDLIEKRLRHTFGDSVRSTYQVLGIPSDLGGAQALFDHSPFDFERWAVSLINAQPNEKQVGDRGIDGVARFPLDAKGQVGRVLVSVKGGRSINPGFVRDLLGTVETQRAQMGVLITMTEPTRGILDAVNHGGAYTYPANQQTFPRVQVITIAQLLGGQRPNMPATLLPYVQAKQAARTVHQRALFE